MPVAVIVLGAVAIGCVPAAHLLASAQWPRRSPAVAIALWQALGLGWGVATVGALAGFGVAGLEAGQAGRRPLLTTGVSTLARTSRGGVTTAPRSGPGASVATATERAARELFGSAGPAARFSNAMYDLRLVSLTASVLLLAVLCWIMLAAVQGVLRARHRQMALLKLLAHGDPKVPGALVVDHPAATAYCVPGLRSAIVISAGTLNLLDQAELAAVLEHERAHLRARHDLVLLPFTALLRAFRWSATAREANRAVSLLVEMMADDRARRHRPARELATALLRVGVSGGGQAPSGALAAADQPGGDLAARVTRLLRPPPDLPLYSAVLLCSVAALVVIAPTAAMLLPL